jgi:hypothetical protein
MDTHTHITENRHQVKSYTWLLLLPRSACYNQEKRVNGASATICKFFQPEKVSHLGLVMLKYLERRIVHCLSSGRLLLQELNSKLGAIKIFISTEQVFHLPTH